MSLPLHRYLDVVAPLKKVLVQTKIDEKLAEKFKDICDANDWKMTDVVRASIRKFVDDHSEKKKSA